MADSDMPGETKPKVESDDVRITFQGDTSDSRRARQRTTDGVEGRGSRSRSRRSLSRDSSRSRLPASPYSGVQIEYRTLSIQVSESRRIGDDTTTKEALPQKNDQEYFSNLNFHELGVEQICQQLNVAQDQGLSSSAAANRMKRDGANTLPRPRSNYTKKILVCTLLNYFYLFKHSIGVHLST